MNPIVCYFVASVMSLASINGIEQEKFTFGVRQITEEIVGQQAPLCPDGSPIYVVVEEIKAPTQGIRVGPFEFKQKKTYVTVKVTKDGKESVGVGTAKMNVAATLLQLQDENLPFEQTEFSIAIKKAIVDALD
jgi:hypothetical protein